MSDPDPRIAPPPPAPLGSLGQSGRGGFEQRAHRSVVELVVVVVVVVALAVGLVAGAGRIAAAAVPWVPLAFDRRVGELLSVEVPMLTNRCENPAPEAYVRAVAAPLLEALGETPYEFHFRVSPDTVPNAFALPGGFVTVNYGLLQAARSGDEVALVLAHELQHVLLRHSTRRTLRQMSGTVLLSLLLGGSDLGRLVDTFSDFAARGYDRDEESEADLEGAKLAARAGIDPKALGEFMARLQEGNVEVPVWMSDHPATETRVEVSQKVPFSGPARELPSPKGLTCDPLQTP